LTWFGCLAAKLRVHRKMLAGFAAVFFVGVVMGWGVGRFSVGPVPDAPPMVVKQETSDTADKTDKADKADKADVGEVGALTSADPQATETSSRTVIEDESFGPALPAEQLSSLPLPPNQAAHAPETGRPNWEKFALPPVHTGGHPMIAVIIDDMGLDKRRSEKIMQLPAPLTISFMSYAEDLGRQTEEARGRGHELMMHVPMEPLAEGLDAGPGALSVNLPTDELKKRLSEDLDRFKGYVGINNHMGSKFTAYEPGMQIVMDELRRRGLLFIDSLTTDHSVGLALAQRSGVPATARNVFLDNAGDIMSVEVQLSKLEELARKKGSAVAIGHPRDATIAALSAWLPTLRDKGLVLVPISEVVTARRATPTATHMSN
jgi:hypothetical protein